METVEEINFEKSIGCFHQHIDEEQPILVVSISDSEAMNEIRKYVKLSGFGYIFITGITYSINKKKLSVDKNLIIITDESKSEKLFALGKKLGKQYKLDSLLFFGKLDFSLFTIDNENGIYRSIRIDEGLYGRINYNFSLLKFVEPVQFLKFIKNTNYNSYWEADVIEISKPNRASGSNEAMAMSAFTKFLMSEKELNEWK